MLQIFFFAFAFILSCLGCSNHFHQILEVLWSLTYEAHPRVGQSVDSALIALAAIFWLIARILTIFDKKYRILTRRDKRESYLIVLQQNNV